MARFLKASLIPIFIWIRVYRSRPAQPQSGWDTSLLHFKNWAVTKPNSQNGRTKQTPQGHLNLSPVTNRVFIIIIIVIINMKNETFT